SSPRARSGRWAVSRSCTASRRPSPCSPDVSSPRRSTARSARACARLRRMNLGGRTALVTGASGGVGQAIARGLAARGAEVMLSARKVEVLEALAAEIGGRVVACDLSDRAAVERLVAEAGPVDVLVASAGIPGSGPLESFTGEEIDRALDVNLRAPIIMTRLMAEGMVERGGGQIVFVSSLSGKAGTARSSIYAATKFGLPGFPPSPR